MRGRVTVRPMKIGHKAARVRSDSNELRSFAMREKERKRL